MKQVAMKGVDGGGLGSSKFGCGAPEDSSFGSVSVDDVWLEDSDFLDELGESPDIIPRLYGAPEAFNLIGLDIRGLGVEIVGFIVGAVAGVETVLELLSGERAHQPGDLNSRSADVHAGDDAHDS